MLVDIRMPGMDGIELLQRVREIDKDIVVIIITAFATVDTAVKALKSGAYDYITKPIDPDYLNHLVDKAHQAAGTAAGEPAPARRGQRAFDRRRDRRRFAGDAEGARARGHRRPDRHHRPHLRGERDRQGACRARDPQQEPAAVLPDGDRQLRRHDRDPAGKRALRPRTRRVHRGAVPPQGESGTGGRRHALPRRDRQYFDEDTDGPAARHRVEAVHPRRRDGGDPIGLPGHLRDEPGSGERRSRTGGSGRICTTGSMCSPYSFRPSGAGGETSRSWLTTSSTSTQSR